MTKTRSRRWKGVGGEEEEEEVDEKNDGKEIDDDVAERMPSIPQLPACCCQALRAEGETSRLAAAPRIAIEMDELREERQAREKKARERN